MRGQSGVGRQPGKRDLSVRAAGPKRRARSRRPCLLPCPCARRTLPLPLLPTRATVLPAGTRRLKSLNTRASGRAGCARGVGSGAAWARRPGPRRLTAKARRPAAPAQPRRPSRRRDRKRQAAAPPPVTHVGKGHVAQLDVTGDGARLEARRGRVDGGRAAQHGEHAPARGHALAERLQVRAGLRGGGGTGGRAVVGAVPPEWRRSRATK